MNLITLSGTDYTLQPCSVTLIVICSTCVLHVLIATFQRATTSLSVVNFNCMLLNIG